MKIMFATDDKTMDSKIAKRFGHARFYLIFNTDNDNLDVRENQGHSEDHSDLSKLVNEDVSHFVIGNIGPHAFNVLKQGNAKIYLARKMTAQEALKQLRTNSLEELDEPTLKKSIDDHHYHDHEHNHGDNHGRHSGRGNNISKQKGNNSNYSEN